MLTFSNINVTLQCVVISLLASYIHIIVQLMFLVNHYCTLPILVCKIFWLHLFTKSNMFCFQPWNFIAYPNDH